jgi:hypothetical protein
LPTEPNRWPVCSLFENVIGWTGFMHNLDAQDVHTEPKFTDLPLGEQFVLWAARIWVKSNNGAPTLHLNLRNGFRAAQLEEGYLILDRFMTLLSTSALKEIRFHCTCCWGITDHEHALLGVIAEFQTGDEANAQTILSEWLPDASAHIVGQEFQAFAMLLKENGLHIRERQWFLTGGEDPTAPMSPLPSVH